MTRSATRARVSAPLPDCPVCDGTGFVHRQVRNAAGFAVVSRPCECHRLAAAERVVEREKARATR